MHMSQRTYLIGCDNTGVLLCGFFVDCFFFHRTSYVVTHLLECCHLVLPCCYMLSAQLFLLPQHIPHRAHSNCENNGSQDRIDSYQGSDSCSLLYAGRCSCCFLRLEIITVERMKIPAFWDAMLCSLLAGCQKLHSFLRRL